MFIPRRPAIVLPDRRVRVLNREIVCPGERGWRIARIPPSRGGGVPPISPFTFFPGNVGNPVGFASTPAIAPSSFAAVSGQAWPGAYSSLTSWPGGSGSSVTISDGTHATSGAGTFGNPWVFAFYDFNLGSGTLTISANNVVFVGCRSQSNNFSGDNCRATGSNISFIYCSMTPLLSKWAFPPNAAWPSAGAGQGVACLTADFNGSVSGTTLTVSSVITGAIAIGQNLGCATAGVTVVVGTTIVSGSGLSWQVSQSQTIASSNLLTGESRYTNAGGYCIPAADGYQFGVDISANGAVTIDHCDIWGFGNAVNLVGSSAQVNITNNWMHDAANTINSTPPSNTNFHTDGPGYLDGLGGPSNVLVRGNTIASIGNTNGIAFQLTSAIYNNIVVDGNYLSGFGNLVAMSTQRGGSDTCTNSAFSNNIIGTDIGWLQSPIYTDYTTMFSGGGNTWQNNKLYVLPGTSPLAVTNPPPVSFSSADSGKYVWPDHTFHTVDF